jgi:hypothetical protein
LAAWKADRLRNGAKYDEPFLTSLIPCPGGVKSSAMANRVTSTDC